MLRVTFHAASERKFQTVIRCLSVLAEQMQQQPAGAWTIYNVNAIKSGRGDAVGVEMVEFYSDEDNDFCEAVEHVIDTIKQTNIDARLLIQSEGSGYLYDPCQYAMLSGRLFSKMPAALAFVVRNASDTASIDQSPAIMAFQAEGAHVSNILDCFNQLADLALRSAGRLACLVQGIGHFEHRAVLLFLFATELELIDFAKDEQARVLSKASNSHAQSMQISLHGRTGSLATQAAQEFIYMVTH